MSTESTLSDCRIAIRNRMEQDYPVFISQFNEAVDKLKDGNFTAEIDLNGVLRESKRMQAPERVSINEAVWYINTMGFYCEGAISKKLEIAVEPIFNETENAAIVTFEDTDAEPAP